MNGVVVGGKYLVVQPIGHGGMGTVYDAIHAKTGRRVALKLIHERLVTSEGGRRRFEREARAAATIDSLHVVQILDSGEDEASGVPFIVMEYLQGEDLRSLLTRGPLPERLAVAIALQICRGLKKAHENDVVHRDLKPGNVYVAKMEDQRRVVKLLDFGIAKLVAESDSATADVTATADVVGSPPYMSPEQLRSPRDVDELTDVWSLGVVLYEMLSGQTPTAGIEPIGARVYAICHTVAPPLRELAPHVSTELAAVVHRALEIEKTKRFGSVDALMTALRSLSTATSTSDILEEDLVFLASDGPRLPVVLDGAPSARSAPRAPRPPWLLAGGGALLVGIVGIVLARASAVHLERPPEVERLPSAGTTAAASPAVPASAPSVVPAPSTAPSLQDDRADPATSRDRPPAGSPTKRAPGAKSAKNPSRPAPTQDGREEL